MAVGVGKLGRTYVCASTDTRPINVSIGTRLYEYDTGRHYIWSGSVWTDFVGGPSWL